MQITHPAGRTQKEIGKEIASLKALTLVVPEAAAPGMSNHAEIEAQIKV